ncbi:MAG: hypothetical protein L0H70_00105 [Xanthomonadales bacterium]|nr:hypothetical protein [Xanthomonadales bacterium]
MQGVDQDYIQAQLAAYQTQVKDYVSTKNADATVGDVIGSKTIVPETLPLLAASLPYTVTAIASRMDTLPDNLRWKFHYALEGETLMTKSLPSLAGHLMALSFDPATAQDEATLESYIPKNITDPSQLPTSLPAGVVKLKAQFSIDGQTIATGPIYSLGDDITVTKGVYQPNVGWQDRTKSYAAGDYRAVGLDTVGVSQAQIDRLQAQIEATKTALQTNNGSGLTKHDLTGALMQTSLANYFAQIRARAELTAQTSDTVTYRLPSFGSISTISQVALFFGVPAKMTPSGVSTDMGRIASISISKTGDNNAKVAFNQSVGRTNSRAESGVLEQQYSTPSKPLKGVTAVQALGTAAAQGQRIYTITQANAATAMGELNLPAAVMDDIANGVNAGLTVTTGQSTINYNGKVAAGYIILDPTTGAAAYKILTGADGGWLYWIGTIMVVLAIAALVVAFGLAFPLLLPLLYTVVSKLSTAIEVVTQAIEIATSKCAWALLGPWQIAHAVIELSLSAIAEKAGIFEKPLEVLLGFLAGEGESFAIDNMCK